MNLHLFSVPHKAAKMKIGDLFLAMVKLIACFPYQPTHSTQSYWVTAICKPPSNVASHEFSSYLSTHIYHGYTEAPSLLCFFHDSHGSLDRLPGRSHHSYRSRRGAKTRDVDGLMGEFLCSHIKHFTKKCQHGNQTVCSHHKLWPDFGLDRGTICWGSGMIRTFGFLFLSQLELPAVKWRHPWDISYNPAQGCVPVWNTHRVKQPFVRPRWQQ